MSDHIAVIIILDGCCSRALQRAKLPFLNAVAGTGFVSFGCRSVYPTATYTAHCSIITGKPPSVHGIVGNSFYDRGLEETVDFDVRNVNEFVASKTIFEMVDGNTVSIGEPITRGADVIVSKTEVQSIALHKQNHYIVERAIEAIGETSPKLAVINFPSVDTIGEKYGIESQELLKVLKEIDRLLAKLMGILNERYEDYLIVVVADHGMTQVKKNVRLDELLGDLNPIVCPSHRSAHIYLNPRKAQEARRRLESDRRFELILSRAEARRISLSGPRTGDLIIFARKGYELSEQRLKGSHGGITDEEMNVPLIANKPEYLDLVGELSITAVPFIVLRYLVEKDAEALVKRALKGTDPSHGWAHTERVLSTATKLATDHGGDVEVVRLACILHDIERGRLAKYHASKSAELASKFLKSRKLPREKILKIVRAIRMHHADPWKLKTLEEKILWDSDKLDALGLVGLARCLQEAGYQGQSIEDAIAHLEGDTKEFESRMHFTETRKMAREKSQRVSEVIEYLKREI
jgi:HD superfamily phosphodiesterase